MMTTRQVAEMNDPSRFAREEAARAATRREDAKRIARRRIRLFIVDRDGGREEVRSPKVG
jgi:hypothetical protein